MNVAIYSKRVLLPEGLTEATVFVSGGKIESIELGKIEKEGFPLDDCGNDVVMPGLIDAHVHINEPGREAWEGFDTATKAAAVGGITTLIDMPLNSSPVSITDEKFQQKLTASDNKLHVNCGFWGGLVPENIDDLDELLESGVLGIKAFLTHSGIDEFPNVTEADLRKALPILKKHDAVLLVHCELDAPHEGIEKLKKNPTSYQAYLASRPKKWEDDAIALMIKLCEEYRVRTHIVHLSSSSSIEQLKKAQAKGLPISVETCTHYLAFNAEDIPDRATEYKCAPPIREKDNNDLLWQALKDRLIEFVITDHSPAPPELKELDSGNFSKAWGGIAGLQFSLPAFWTAAKDKGYSIVDVSELMSSNVAKFLQMQNSKGKLAAGYDADITIWNPEESFVAGADKIWHKHPTTPYANKTYFGKVNKTYVSGYKVFEYGNFNSLSKGKIILKD